VVKNEARAELEIVFCESAQLGQASKGNLRLDHPELGKVSGSVRYFRTEGGAKRVDIRQRHRVAFNLQLQK
jgi:hypothetical protein